MDVPLPAGESAPATDAEKSARVRGQWDITDLAPSSTATSESGDPSGSSAPGSGTATDAAATGTPPSK